jgi:hypothetical protein
MEELMPNGSIDDLKERVGKLEDRVTTLEHGVVGLCQRLFRAERKLLAAGTVLSLEDVAGPDQGKLDVEQLNVVVGSLSAALPDFKLRLEGLESEFKRCCVLLEADEPADLEE